MSFQVQGAVVRNEVRQVFTHRSLDWTFLVILFSNESEGKLGVGSKRENSKIEKDKDQDKIEDIAQTYVWYLLMCVCETWSLTRSLEKNVEAEKVLYERNIIDR